MARDDQRPSPPLLTAISLAEAATISRGSTIPILSHVRLIADQNRLTAHGTDLDTWISVEVGRAGLPFDVAVLGRLLLDAVSFHGGETEFALVSDEHLTVGTDPAFLLPTLAVEDFPVPTGFDSVAAFDLPAAQLLADLKAVSPAISTELTRFYLNGICFHVVGGDLAMAATDGYRLHQIRRPQPGGASELPSSIVRRQAVSLLIRALEAAPGMDTARCEFGTDKARFTVGDTTIATNLLGGTFPQYERVIPEYGAGELHGTLAVSAAELGCIAAAAMLISEKKRASIFDFQAGKISLERRDGASMVTDMLGTVEGKPPPKIAVMPGRLADVCAACGEGTVQVQFGDALAPIRFDAQDGAFVGVVMPMRVS